MTKLVLLVVAMVLLSGAAWGEYASVKELRAAWFLNDCESGTSTFRVLNIPDPKNPNCTFETSGVTTFGSVPDGWTPFMEMNHFLVIGRRVCKFGAPDPTAWKQTDSKYGVEDESDSKCLERYLISKDVKAKVADRVLNWCKENPPWADSRYRLERNEVTGQYRITEKPKFPLSEKESWLPVKCTNSQYSKYEPEWIECLNEYRNREREDKAWRPIK